MIERQRPRLRKPRRSARPCARRRRTRRTRRGRRRTRSSRAGGIEHNARSVRALLPGLPGCPRLARVSPERLIYCVPLLIAVRCNYALGNYRDGPVSKAVEDLPIAQMFLQVVSTMRCTESHCAMQRQAFSIDKLIQDTFPLLPYVIL